MNTESGNYIAAVLRIMPKRIAEAITASAALFGGELHEIRLYRGGNTAVVHGGRTIRTSSVCTEAEFDTVLKRLCDNSLYAHGETIRDGYIFSSDGFRAGVCGRAVMQNGRIELVTDISSMCIRIPIRIPGAADDLLPHILGNGEPHGMLIWSPPGVGKTTLLRELAVLLSAPERCIRCAVVDTRLEIGNGIDGNGLDILRGYPRAVGMEIAVRTMAPQIVICDEIAGESDAQAVRNCLSSGVAVIASAHAASREDLLRRAEIRRLIEENVFPTLVGLYRGDGEVQHHIMAERTQP